MNSFSAQGDHVSIEEAKKQTPMMERYLEVKGQNPGSLLLFRMGDFYELFYDDAQLAARVLGLTLTSRDKGSPNPVPMAGLSVSRTGELPSKADSRRAARRDLRPGRGSEAGPGLVRREVTRIVTPGTLVDEGLLDPRRNNFLASVFPEKSGIGLAWLELSTGRFIAAHVEPQNLPDELARIQPAECLVPDQALPDRILERARRARRHAPLPPAPLELRAAGMPAAPVDPLRHGDARRL